MHGHAGAHRVELDVTATGKKMSLAVDRRRAITALPQGACPPPGGVDMSDVAPAECLHHAGASSSRRPASAADWAGSSGAVPLEPCWGEQNPFRRQNGARDPAKTLLRTERKRL